VFVPKVSGDPNQREELLKLLKKPNPSPMSNLYFFCHCSIGHGNKPVLRFGNTSNLSNIIEQIDFGHGPLLDHPVVFLNACTTAAADVYHANQLEEIFFRRRCRAYIGTEIKVPIKLASRFASIFYHYFYRKVDPETPIAAGEAFWQTRRFLWNQYRNIGGLFYTYINEYQLYMATEDELDRLGYR
jgi:hypothetical protein